MRIQLDFTFESEKGQQSDDLVRAGITQATDQLFLGGEEDVSEALPFVQVWVDLRNEGCFNRIVEIPLHVTYIRIPIADGDINRAFQVFSKAKHIIQTSIDNGEKVVVTCRAGVSRSVVLVWWILAEQWKDPNKAWNFLKWKRPFIEPDERFSPFIKEHILCIRGSNK